MESPDLPTLNYAVPSPDQWRARVGRLAAWFVTAGTLWTIPAIFLAAREIESIIGTGPVLLLLGLVSCSLSLLGNALTALPASLMQILYPMLIFLIIFLGHWSPGRAHDPVIIMTLVFIALLIPVTVLAWFRRPVRRARY